MSERKQRILVGTRKGLFTLRRAEGNGGKWEIGSAAFVGDQVPMLLYDRRDGSHYAALFHGHFGSKMHRSTDEGVSWKECAVPAYPAVSEGKNGGSGDSASSATTPGGPSLDLIWALEAADPKKPGTLWAGTVPGGLFRSDDFSQSWQLVESLWDHPKRAEWMGGGMDKPGIHSICVHPNNASHVDVGVSCGGVWQTRDAGKTWACKAKGMIARFMPPDRQDDPNVQDPHRVVRSPSHPDVLWSQHHCGIFRTTDGCNSWHEITVPGASSFGFAVAVHPTDPDTAWFLPATSDELRVPAENKIVVTRTRDGGKSFDLLTRGLPQNHAYHIVFRHCLDVDATGECLAFGSTTGSLWTSDDAGDSWMRVSAELPPIFCLRFAGE